MKVRQLSDMLSLTHGEGRVSNILTVISHWIKKIFDSPKTSYTTKDESEIKSLYFLETLKIVEIKNNKEGVTAVLTKDGKELYRDFLAKGYYGTSEGF